MKQKPTNRVLGYVLGFLALASVASSALAATPIATITAPASVTADQAGYAASVPTQTGVTYEWTITNGTILVGATTDTLAFTAGPAGAVGLTCKVTDASGVSATGTTSVAILAAAPPQFNLQQALTDFAQKTTLAFDGLGIITGNLQAQSFFPPGKVADYWGFQYLRDNDPDHMGHNTSFLTRVACNVIFILSDAQLAQLKALAASQVSDINQYAYLRYPLMAVFRKLVDGEIPAGSSGLSVAAVKAASRQLYQLDGQISYDRAVLYAQIFRSLTRDQKIYLGAMAGKGWASWPPKTMDDIRDKMQGLSNDEAVAVMTYASDMFSWYVGSVTADVYFCPERHGTYFGSFYMKDAPAMGHEGYTINEQLTATAGAALCDSSKGYVTPEQAAIVSALVETQRSNLYAGPTNIVNSRTAIGTTLRSLITSSEPSATFLAQVKAAVLDQSGIYGDLDGENVASYATAFAQVAASLSTAQKQLLLDLRRSILSGTYADGTPFDFTICNTYFRYAEVISDPSILIPYITNIGGFFGTGVAPSASFTLSPSAPQAGQSVQLTDASTGVPTSWSWNFGDSTTSTLQNPVHVWASPGNYTVSLVVTNALGSSSATQTVAVSASPGTTTSYPVVDTGQARCYDASVATACPVAGQPFYGQDAQRQGRQLHYTVSAGGLTVFDNNTGLTWQRSPDTNGDGRITKGDKLTWPQAQLRPAALNAINYGGYNDWRLPTVKELYSLIDFRGTDPSGYSGSDTSGLTPFIDTSAFQFAYGQMSAGERLIDSQYASNSRYAASSPEKLFGVNFADGRIKGYDLTMPDGSVKTFFVQCVRGNTSYGTNAFVDNAGQTVTDNATGLMWSKADSAASMNWQDALSWVQARNASGYLGHNDWRLPNAKELQSILDYTRSPETTGSAAIDPIFGVTTITNEAGKPDYPWYWASTTHAAYTGSGASGVYLCFGRCGGWQKATPSATCYTLTDVHGAGAQRSDPKTTAGKVVIGTACSGGTAYGLGPQGDVQRATNFVRLVRDASDTAPACSSVTINPASANPGSGAGSQPVTLTGNPAGCTGGNWTATGNGSWLTVSPASGTGPGTVTVSWTANSGAARTGTAAIAGQTFTVNQAAGTVTCSSFTINPVSANPGSGAGSQPVTLTGNPAGCTGGNWTATGNGSWLTVSPASGFGPGTVTVSWTANSGAARTGTAAIAGQTFTVNQARGTVVCTDFAINPRSSVPGGAAGSQPVSIIGVPAGCSGGNWTATGNGSWLMVSPAGGTGSGIVMVSWTANPGRPRTGQAIIANQIFTVKQGGGR